MGVGTSLFGGAAPLMPQYSRFRYGRGGVGVPVRVSLPRNGTFDLRDVLFLRMAKNSEFMRNVNVPPEM